MNYCKEEYLKNGHSCLIRSAEENDAQALLSVFLQTHEETDFLSSYPDENSFTIEQEKQFISSKLISKNEVEICAFVDGNMAGCAGISAVGMQEKVRHRAEFGISILEAYWGLGIGRKLAEACIACAKKAGYMQVELNVVAANERAIRLYRSLGFEEFGRNPLGFRSRLTGWQETVWMRLTLT